MTKSYLEQKEVKNLEIAATNLRDKLLIHLLSRLGCRISEILGLTVEDIDLVAGTVRIQHLKNRMRLFCPAAVLRWGRSMYSAPPAVRKWRR